VGGELGYELSVKTVICERNRHVCLTATIGSAKAVSLNKAEVSLGSKAEHKLAKTYNFHFYIFLSMCDNLVFAVTFIAIVIILAKLIGSLWEGAPVEDGWRRMRWNDVSKTSLFRCLLQSLRASSLSEGAFCMP
jgi:hypothetical protein